MEPCSSLFLASSLKVKTHPAALLHLRLGTARGMDHSSLSLDSGAVSGVLSSLQAGLGLSWLGRFHWNTGLGWLGLGARMHTALRCDCCQQIHAEVKWKERDGQRQRQSVLCLPNDVLPSKSYRQDEKHRSLVEVLILFDVCLFRPDSIAEPALPSLLIRPVLSMSKSG